MASTRGRQVVVPLTNKSGGQVIAGDVVIIDAANNDAFTTTTTGGYTGIVGVAQETIASNAVGRILMSGYAALVNVNASVTRGHFGYTHTVVKQAADAGASRIVGAFCQFLTGGTTPTAHLFAMPDASSAAGNVATDAIWDAAGDLVVGTGANTAAKLTIGATGSVLTSDGSTAIWPAAKVVSDAAVATGQTQVGNNSWADLTTPGPAVTVTVPASGKVKVTIVCNMADNNAAGYCSMGFALSGATTQAAGTANAAGAVMELDFGSWGAAGQTQHGATWLMTGLAAGSTTFTAKYKQWGTAGTATYTARYILVETIP